ncbi:hypothetical protein [Symmachiella dynata]|nr:hypothetical protein [Symmachiella dynata]
MAPNIPPRANVGLVDVKTIAAINGIPVRKAIDAKTPAKRN